MKYNATSGEGVRNKGTIKLFLVKWIVTARASLKPSNICLGKATDSKTLFHND